MEQWYLSKVFKGTQTGRTINFPTINLDPTVLPAIYKEGVYASLVNYNQKEYKGALYFGPRLVLKETKNVLEIFVFDFDKEIYNETIEFQIRDYVRGVLNFKSMEQMKKQLEDDISEIKHLFAGKDLQSFP